MRKLTAVSVLLATTAVVAGDRDEIVVQSESVELAAREIGGGWREWQGFPLVRSEDVTALHVTPADADPAVSAWVGTSDGWLYRGDNGNWTIEGYARGVEITGIAIRSYAEWGATSHTLWLSTSDGVREVGPFGRLHNGDRTVTSTRTYYAHLPCISTFVVVDSDYARPMGFVDDVFVRSEPGSRPIAISGEHGVLFYIGYWHIDSRRSYAGEQLTWVDPDAPIPHRRPTCIVEDASGNRWVGTDGDGAVRFDANADFFEYGIDEDDPGFVRFAPDDIGCQFTRVVDAETGLDGSVWFALTDYGRHSFIARFHNDEWTVVEIPPELGRTSQSGDESRQFPPVPVSLAEVAPGELLIGAKQPGNLKMDWESRSFERVAEFERLLLEIEVSDDGTVWATTSNGVYERWPQSM